MTTTDREPLYQQAKELYERITGRHSLGAVRAVVDLVLDSRPEPTADGEALAQLVRDVRDGDGRTVQIGGVLIAQCDERGRTEAERIAKLPWEVLNKATAPVLRRGYDPSNLYTVLDVADYLTALADRLEAEHHAAQEKAATEAAREKAATEVGRDVPQVSRDYLVGALTTAARIALNDVSKQLAPFLTDGAVAELASVDVSEAVEATADAIISDLAVREKLIEQAAWIVAATRDHGPDRIVSIQDRQIAEGLAAAGLLSAPTTDGGAA